MMINVGQMKDKIEIQEYQEPNTLTHEWITIHETWTYMRKQSYRSINKQSMTTDVLRQNKILYIRYTDKIHGDCRILFRGDVYNIEDIQSYHNGIFLEILLTAPDSIVGGVV
jgi:head-tail adaptor